MIASKKPLFLTHDAGLHKHWVEALGTPAKAALSSEHPLASIHQAGSVAWIDLSLPNLPPWEASDWTLIFGERQIKVVAASSSPNDDEGMAALDAGCVAYCHAFSDALTLQRVREVVLSGNVWVGRNLMNRLLRSTARLAPKNVDAHRDWHVGLSTREAQVAKLAANGASNQLIAAQCQITERTVKAHLSAVFVKLKITDRLQLALRVHGIS